MAYQQKTIYFMGLLHLIKAEPTNRDLFFYPGHSYIKTKILMIAAPLFLNLFYSPKYLQCLWSASW